MNIIRYIGDVHGRNRQYKRILKDALLHSIPSIQVGDLGLGFVRYNTWNHDTYSPNPPHRLMVEANAEFIRGNHDCCSSATECLTKRGWLSYDLIRHDDEVLSLNNRKKPVWTKINEIKIFPYDGKMININSLRLSMEVTPSHRVLILDNGMLKFIKADSLKKDFYIPVSGLNINQEYPIEDSIISLIGWILTDGGLSHKNRNYISIYQSKYEGQIIIENLLKKLNLSYSKVLRNRTHTHVNKIELKGHLPEIYYRLTSESSNKISQWLCLKIKSERELPKWAFNLSPRQFSILLEALIGGDGCWDGVNPANKSCAVIYSPKKLLDSIQSAAILNGWRARLAIDNRGDPRLCLTKGTHLYVEKQNISIKDYSGFVWCLSVPNENFMIRNNGCAYFTGNSPSVCKRNSQWIPDGTVRGNMMLIGGAISRDIFYPNGKPRRHEGYDWWPDEELGYIELMNMIDKYEKVKPEIMVTHDCPSSVGKHLLSQMTGKEYNNDSKTAPALQQMWEIHKPKLWIFGHWHIDVEIIIEENTRFICLNELSYIDVDTDTLEIINRGSGNVSKR